MIFKNDLIIPLRKLYRSKSYFISVCTVALCLVSSLLLEKSSMLPQGVFVSIVELLFEGAAVCILFSRKQAPFCTLQRATLRIAFLSLFVADFSYMVFYYIIEFENNRWFPIALLTQFNYFVFFGTCCLFILSAAKQNIKKVFFNFLSVPLFVVIAVIGFYFVMTPFLINRKPELDFFFIAEFFSLSASSVALFLSLIVTLSSRSLFWQSFTTGLIALILGDWAMRIETYHVLHNGFGFYEFFWGLGVCLTAASVVKHGSLYEQIEDVFTIKSLLNIFKFGMVATILLIAIFIFASKDNPYETIKIISMGTAFGLIFSTILGQIMTDEIKKCSHALAKLMTADLVEKQNPLMQMNLPLEFNENIKILYHEHVRHYMEHISVQNQYALSEKMIGVFKQVAHDIRSPLAALGAAISDLSEVSEEKRILIRSAVHRIEDITNDLAQKKNEQLQTSSPEHRLPAPHLISSILDLLVSEKRIEYRSRPTVLIHSTVENNSYGAFANVVPTDFKRVLSNLINNAVEALHEGGDVNVCLKADVDQVMITVTDTGCGIPEHILPRLMHKGATFGKVNGSGIGLHSARETLEAFGGHVSIVSTVGQGTTVTLLLPRVATPGWFLEKVTLSPDALVVILDDDASIHHVWSGRLKSAGVSDENIIHHSSSQELLEWHKSHMERLPAQSFLALCDYELLGSSLSGFEVIRRLGLEQSAVLVTSHFEEAGLKNDCLTAGLRMLPKNLAGFVPITVLNATSVQTLSQTFVLSDLQKALDAILLDDDDLVHLNWQMAARMKKKSFSAYHTLHALRADLPRIPRQTAIYIDSCLGEGQKGEVIAQELHGLGFKNLYLATGKDPSEFGTIPWIKGIQGKMPPWG